MKKGTSIRLVLSIIVVVLTSLPPGGAGAEPPRPHPVPAGMIPPSDEAQLLPAWATASSTSTLDGAGLGGGAVADAPYGPAPTVDGEIAPGEYAGAHRLTFPTYGGEMEVFLRQGEGQLFIAFESPDTTPYPFHTSEGEGPAFQVLLDIDDDDDATPQLDDFRLTVNKGGTLAEEEGNGDDWVDADVPTGWTADVYTTTWGWQAEFAIGFSKLGVTSGSTATIGLGLAEVWTLNYLHDYVWPEPGDTAVPDSWGTLVSSSDWSDFYWKPGPWEDYAPSGLPDFDQRQVITPTLCGPFAAANSLWWFDARFEDQPVGPVGPTMPISDTYPLVSPYGAWDDHDPQNVVPLALDLAVDMNTDPVTGTQIYDMYEGIQRYLRLHGMWDHYMVTLVEKPTADWIADQARRGEDLVLLLGFWQEDIDWHRVGGHYVTVAGVSSEGGDIAISDPAQNWAEEPAGSGRVLSGTLISHSPTPDHPAATHNDAGNVSHDTYGFDEAIYIGGEMGSAALETLGNYQTPSIFTGTPGINPNPNWHGATDYIPGADIRVAIEYALAVSPYTWKASGRWVADAGVPLYGKHFEPFADYAPSGVPDFDQRQDNWKKEVAGADAWTFCGPVAVANSLWWFDSKFEYQGATPPTISGTHPLVASYEPWYDTWDDHDPRNIHRYGDELVSDLADDMDTDGTIFQDYAGTYITDVIEGLESYLTDRGIRGGYVITPVQSPDFWWVAEEVERSNDVILLLNFWQDQSIGWTKLGGHYVTVPGVDKQGGLIGFSDPYFDRMETVLPPEEFIGAPLWTGRVGSDGDPPLGGSGLVPTYTHMVAHSGVYTLHNDAANVSHDVYPVIAAPPGPAGTWEPEGYAPDRSSIDNFRGVNMDVGGGFPPVEGVPVHTVVEWAVAVAPMADVTARKEVVPKTAIPGDWVTFTIAFSNTGPLLATDVVLDDGPPDGLTDVTVLGTWVSTGEPIVARPGVSFTWDLPDLAWGDRGLITMTAQIDPQFSWPATITLTNWVSITTGTREQMLGAPNVVSATLPVQTADVAVDQQVSDDVVIVGDWVTYTIVFSNNGPAPAANVVLTDPIHDWLTDVTTVGWTVYTGTLERTGYYVWDAGDIPVGGRGELRIYGQVSPPPGLLGTLPSQIEIRSETPEWRLANNTSRADLEVVEYEVALDPSVVAGAGPAGGLVVHTLVVTNTGTYTDTYGVSWVLGGETWTPSLPSEVGPLAAGRSEPVEVEVAIPSHAMAGESSQVTVTLTSQGDGTKRTAAVLTTEVEWKIYVPLVLDSYP